jgi:hypothetical protein
LGIWGLFCFFCFYDYNSFFFFLFFFIQNSNFLLILLGAKDGGFLCGGVVLGDKKEGVRGEGDVNA